MPALALVAFVLSTCSQDWSAARPDDGGGDLVEGDGGADGNGGGDADTGADADGDGAPPVFCGNGSVEPPEECDGDPPGACSSGSCGGTRACSDECVWEACDPGPAPANDRCDSPDLPVIDGSTGSHEVRGTTCAAADDVALPTCSGAGSGSPDVVHLLELGEASWVTIDSGGSDFATALRVFADAGCSEAEIACDAGEPSGGSASARVSMLMEPGSYRVVVDGAGPDDRGNYALDVTASEPPAPPANDACVDAALLYVESAIDEPGARTGTTTGASHEDDTCGAAPEVWYRFSLRRPAVVYFDTVDGGDWDSVLSVRRDSCWTTEPAVCADDSCGGRRSQFVGALEDGNYLLAVGGRDAGQAGDFTLRYQVGNYSCGPATVIPSDGTYLGSTLAGLGRSTAPCSDASGSAPEFLYNLGLCPGRTVRASTCHEATGFDTVLTFGSGDCLHPDAAASVCNDDDEDGTCDITTGPGPSTVVGEARAGGLYFLIVDGAGGSSGGPFGLVVEGM